jgi:hypothetical protein
MAYNAIVEPPNINQIIENSLILLFSLFIFTPVLVFLGMPQIFGFLIIFVSLGVMLAINKNVLAILISTVYILMFVNADVPIVTKAEISERISLFVFEPFAFLLFALLAYQYIVQDHSRELTRIEAVTAIAAGGFVFWSLVAGVFGSKVSQFVGIVYFFDNFHLLFVFLLTTTVLTLYSKAMVLIPVIGSIVANLFYSAAQVVSGRSIGFTYFGEGPRLWFWDPVQLGPISLTRGIGGGFVGNPRELMVLSLLVLPLVIYAISLRDQWKILISSFAVICIAVLTIAANSENALISQLYLLISIIIIYSAYRSNSSIYRALQIPLLGIVAVILTLFTLSVLVDTPIDIVYYLDDITGDTLISRLRINNAALALGMQNLLFGIGGKNFILMSTDLGFGDTFIHNIFLANFAYLGLIGVTFYIIFVWSVFTKGLRLVSNLDKMKDQFVWSMILLGLIGYVLYAQSEVVHYYEQARFGFWMTAGIIVGVRIGPE